MGRNQKQTIKKYRRFLQKLSNKKENYITNLAELATEIGINRNVGAAGLRMKLIVQDEFGVYTFYSKRKADKADAKILLERTNELTNSYRY